MPSSDTKPQKSDKTPSESAEVGKGLQAQLAEKMMGLFDLVVSDRGNYFSKNPDKVPDKKSAPSIINSYSVTNAAISGGVSLIPGPWGMLAAVPEVAAVIRNQLAMIYDIGMAYGKSKVLTKELLAGVLLTAMGASAGTLLVMHGGKVLVRRVALRVFQQIVLLLAGKVTQQVLKSMISKWLPVVGAVAMAAWSNYLTRQVGKKAVEIFEKDIEIAPEVIDEEVPAIAAVEQLPGPPQPATENLKIQAFINLMKVDGKIKPEEREYVQTLVDHTNLAEEEKANLLNAIDLSTKFTVDYSTFASMPDDAIGLLVDLVALAKRDGEFHVTEKMYIKQAGKLMGFSDSDIEETMASIG